MLKGGADSIWGKVPCHTVDRADLDCEVDLDQSKPDWAQGVHKTAREFHRDVEVLPEPAVPDDLSVHERQDMARRPVVRNLTSPRTAVASSEFSDGKAGLVGVTHSASKKHLEGWIKKKRGPLECDVTTADAGNQAAHLVEKRWTLQARMAIYYALRGWISPNSRINYFYGAYFCFPITYPLHNHNSQSAPTYITD